MNFILGIKDGWFKATKREKYSAMQTFKTLEEAIQCFNACISCSLGFVAGTVIEVTDRNGEIYKQKKF